MSECPDDFTICFRIEKKLKKFPLTPLYRSYLRGEPIILEGKQLTKSQLKRIETEGKKYEKEMRFTNDVANKKSNPKLTSSNPPEKEKTTLSMGDLIDQCLECTSENFVSNAPEKCSQNEVKTRNSRSNNNVTDIMHILDTINNETEYTQNYNQMEIDTDDEKRSEFDSYTWNVSPEYIQSLVEALNALERAGVIGNNSSCSTSFSHSSDPYSPPQEETNI